MSTPPNFDDATTVTEVSSGDDPDVKTWSGYMTADWSIGQVPNGGYTSALVVRALSRHCGVVRPSSLTTHYYRPAIADAPVTITTTILRRGRSTVHGEASFEQDNKVRARSMAVFSDYPSDELMLASPPPSIQPPEDCDARDPMSQGFNMSLLETLDVRLDLGASGPKDRSGFDGWVRFRDERANDELALALFVDSFPPAILRTSPGTGWVPTIELTTHIRAQAAAGWVQAQIVTDTVRGGQLIEDVRLWDSTGALVAQARQLAMLMPK